MLASCRYLFVSFISLLFVEGIKGQSLFLGGSDSTVEVEVSIVEFEWLDSNTYQFIAVRVLGLPEVAPAFTRLSSTSDSLNQLIPPYYFSGGYSMPILVSKKQTFYPVASSKELIDDTVTGGLTSELTSLFLVDDFDKLKVGNLLLISNGVFGNPMQSQAYMFDHVQQIDIKRSSLKTRKDLPVATKAWYNNWLMKAPESYWDMRGYYREQVSGNKHQNYEYYMGKAVNKTRHR